MITFAHPYQVLSWAPLGGGFRRASIIGNHQVLTDERAATEAPARHLATIVRAFGGDPRAAVMMMTGASMRRMTTASARHRDLVVQAWTTAGFSNALRIGDPATVEHRETGTINQIVAISQPLSRQAMVEAVQLVVEARVVAMLAANVASKVSSLAATGTGTDCVAIAAPAAKKGAAYCGKHTRLGELIGRAALTSCERAIARCMRSR